MMIIAQVILPPTLANVLVSFCSAAPTMMYWIEAISEYRTIAASTTISRAGDAPSSRPVSTGSACSGGGEGERVDMGRTPIVHPVGLPADELERSYPCAVIMFAIWR